jgi:hypothetical protein
MQIQVNTDNNVDGHAALVQRVEADVSSALARYDGRLTRIEVHLGDVNAARPGETDKRCLIEARPARRHIRSASWREIRTSRACSASSGCRRARSLTAVVRRRAPRGSIRSIASSHC